MSNTAEQSEDKIVNPLLSRQIRPIRNWHEWLEVWGNATTYEEMLGLLHIGFDTPIRSYYGESKHGEADRVAFYLKVADNWYSVQDLTTLEDREEFSVWVKKEGQSREVIVKVSDLRQSIAQKAFDMLCSSFFKLELSSFDEFRPEWVEWVVSDTLFPVILHFFRATERWGNDGIEVPNLPKRIAGKKYHQEVVVEKFLCNLAGFLWGWKAPECFYDHPQKEEMNRSYAIFQQKLDTAKPWMVDMLVRLRRFDVLTRYLDQFSEECLERLREIAMNNTLWQPEVQKPRKVESINEAILAGSEAAQLILLHQIRSSEAERIKRLCEAEEAVKEAKRNLTKLRR